MLSKCFFTLRNNNTFAWTAQLQQQGGGLPQKLADAGQGALLKALQDKVAIQRASARKSGSERNADAGDKGSSATSSTSCSTTRNNVPAYVRNAPDDRHARSLSINGCNANCDMGAPNPKVLRSHSMSSCDTHISMMHVHASDGDVVQLQSVANTDTGHVAVARAAASMVISRVEQGVNVVQNRSFKGSSRALDVCEATSRSAAVSACILYRVCSTTGYMGRQRTWATRFNVSMYRKCTHQCAYMLIYVVMFCMILGVLR
jgi:hypothetical protein